MLDEIYTAMIADDFINSKAYGRIKYYEYPENGDFTGSYIVIDPLDPPLPGDYAGNKWLTDDYLFQIDVWSKERAERDALAKRIRKVVWDGLGFAQYGGGGDEYNVDLSIYRDARRYRGKVYREDFEQL